LKKNLRRVIRKGHSERIVIEETEEESEDLKKFSDDMAKAKKKCVVHEEQRVFVKSAFSKNKQVTPLISSLDVNNVDLKLKKEATIED